MSGLQYRKTSPGSNRGTPVDWEAFDETLARVDPRFADPRFDSLKHVLTVLRSSNAEQELEELREQRAAVEELVEGVVEGYHAGFNKAAHNYSLILRLFTESKVQLESLQRSLEAARRRLGAHSRTMVAQYQRDVMLRDTLRLLDDIQACLDVPARVQRLEEGKEWAMAVSVLLDGCNRLARQELQAVGALSEVAEDMGRRRAALQMALVAELESRAYRLDGQAVAANGGRADTGSMAAAGREQPGAAAVPRLNLPTFQPRGSSSDAEFSSAAGNLSGRALPPRPPGATKLGRTASWGRDGAALLTAPSTGGDQLASLASMPRRGTHRRAQTLGGIAAAASGLTEVDGHLVETELPVAALVDCVAQLGGLHDAQQALRRHMPRQLRAVMAAALDSFPRDQRLPADEYAREQRRQQQQEASAGGGADISVPAAVATTAQALLQHVLNCCMQAFQQVTRLLQMLSMARVPKPSSGLELLLRQQHQQRMHAAAVPHPPGAGPSSAAAAASVLPPTGPPGPEATRAEVSAAWVCLQHECQRLMAALLDAPPPAQRAQRGEEQADVPLAGWLASVGGELEAAPAVAASEAGTLTFSLEHEVPGLLTVGAGDLAAGGDAVVQPGRGGGEEFGELKARIQGILGGHPGGTALVANLYRPILSFAEAAERHVGSLVDTSAEPANRMAALLSMPWRAGSELPTVGADRVLLRSYVESFLRMEFLPAVYVSARARCAAAVEDADAFKPRPRLRQPYQAGPGVEGRPLVPAALATEALVGELLGWAGQVAPFATHLTGVVENALGRVVDAFEARLARLLGGTAAGRLAESLPVVQLMVKEPAAALLGSPVAFFVGRNTEAMESWVSSVIAAGFGANDEAVESDILARLLAERPVAAASLLSAGGDLARLASLAALSDSLDYIADAVLRCTASQQQGGAPHGGAAGSGGPGGSALPLLQRRDERHSSENSSVGGTSGTATPTPAGEASRQQLGGMRAGASSSSQPAAATVQPAAVPAPSGPSWQQQLLGTRFKPWRKPSGEEAGGGLTEGLAHLCDRCRSLAGLCVRALRLDLLLLLLFHLQQLPRSSYLCSTEEEAREVDECVTALARLAARLDEGLEPYLPPHKRAYAFASLAPAAARIAVWLLPDIRALNHLGVQRMCRMLASLQPALSGLGGGGSVGGYRPDAARQFDRAKLYYTLLTYSAEGLVATVAERPHRFTPQEYLALLAASVQEREVTPEHRAALQRVLVEAGRLAKPASKANAALQAIAKAIKQ